MTEPMVSCVCCTYGRWSFVREALTFYALQDYAERELVIFNTHEVPLIVEPGLADALAVRVINARGDYKSLGQVRALALAYARGAYYACWDDDDLWTPWHLKVAMARISETGTVSWKPSRSWWTMNGGKKYDPSENQFEASIVCEIEAVRKYGFQMSNGSEHLPWLEGTRAGTLTEDVGPWMSYAYRWGNGLHHMSGGRPQDVVFGEHNAATQEHGDGKPLTLFDAAPVYRELGASVLAHFGAETQTAWLRRLEG